MMESPVAAGGPRNTSVIVLTLDTNEVYVVVSLSSRTDTQVIYIDPTTGSLQHNRKLGYDVFNSQDEALNHITDASNLICKSTTYAKAILGYAVLGSFALLLVATRLTASIPYLPGGGCVYTISESKWIKILLQNPQPQGKGEVKNIQELTEFEIDGKHYFCETRDITRPFPSRISQQSPDDEFVWNGWFSTAFRRIGLEQHCVILLQGFVEYRTFGSLGQQEGIVALIARRSRLHPGTRYLARGINSCYSTGNEIECEQLVWVPKRAGQSVPFNTYIWRRGTIPIWWGADLKMTAAEAVIYVSDHDPYKGSARYYQRLSTRYDARDLGVVGTNQNKGGFVPIVCVNLLRNGEGKSESILVQHFEESLNHIRSTRKLPSTRLHLINYDWHTSIRLKGEQQTIEGLWYHLKGPTISIGISEGDYLPSRQHMNNFQGEIIYNDDLIGFFCLRVHQNGVIRYNCADSLDRTNAASYFGGLQVFTEQCRRLGICLDSDLVIGRQSPNNHSGSTTSSSPGWKKQSNDATGTPNYTDQNTRTTSGKHPCPDKPWKHFDMTFEEFKRSTILSPVCQLADLFLISGDIHATIYTGSKAMHSHILNIFSDEAGKSKQFSVAQNVKITLQRRYNNAVVDSYRQKQLEMFLGLRLFKHLPSVSIRPLHVLSRRSGCLLKPIASIEESSGDGDSLLSFRQKDIIWVSQQAADIIQLFVYLREPCHVCQLLLTISHGADDSTYPSTLDVRTGRDLDVLKLVLEGASIPRCANGTNMVIPISGPISDKDMALTGTAASLPAHRTKFPFLYDSNGLEGELDFLTRVVVLTFYPAESTCSPVTLGEVEILGISLPWRGMLASEGPGRRLWESVNNMREDANSFPSDTDSNPTVVALTNDVLPHEKSDTYTSPQVDLLSGEDIDSEPVSQPMTEISLHDSSLDLCHGHKEEADSQRISLQDKIPIKMGVEQYISCFELLTAMHGDNKLGFVEAMKLEIERLRLNLSAAERDRALSSIGIDPATINPNTLLEESYIGSLCKAANSLAVLGQAFLEDRTTGLIGLGPVDDDIDIDFWNINRIGEECCGDPCQVRAETSTLTSSSQSIFSCSACQRKVCRVCCAGKGAILLVRNQTGGTSSGDSSLNRSVTMDGVICKLCCQHSVLDALTLDCMRVLISQRRSTHAETATYEVLSQVVGKNYFSRKKESSDKYAAAKSLQELLNEEESLAEFPFGSFLHSVESASGSAPPLSLLAPLDTGSRQSYWKAPPCISSVEFIIVLGNLSDVSGVVLLVSPCGYSMSDSPTVQIWASQKIHKEERSCVGKWDVRSLITSSPELSGPEKSDKTLRHIKFAFRNPVRCRLIWIKLSIQMVGSNSVSFEKGCNLLSLDEEDLSSGLGRRASIAGTSETDPCLHAKRILVVGNSVKADIADSSSRTSERASSLKNWLEKAPLLNRYRVQVESEKLIENALVLEQFVSLASPTVAGFRLDGFSAIKPRLTHSPSSNVNPLDASSIVFDHRFISPPVLHIQVSTLQGSSEEMVVVAEYRIPEVKGGTAIYFDLPKAISSRRIWFRLVGDIARFADDPEEGEGGRPLAAGLCLLNRIKLYYYAQPNDLGRWASLSGI
ncbi:probable phosphoinositide phosphatase SAC9 [Cynara cardunculus var. scolymus]|uniref:probable phosphoinositide phosphatase SAC9 n=1 Tax=Cynara cardunculus var. scolymus TaxID=59895 RepID=UPI000D62A060|nr:probable phosphoinositide phosphatase SAC9 [Cynara cardunculus var. scolymus]